MKRCFLITLLTLLCFSVQAQHYQSIFGKQSTSWEIAWNNLGGWRSATVAVQKDTLVNGLMYKKLTVSGRSYAVLREDTIIGKVWYKKLYPRFPQVPDDTMEVLLFDYNLSIGDTFNIDGEGYGLYAGYPDSFNVVNRVYYQHGQKHIEFKGPVAEPFIMIEGIGGTFGVIWKQYSGAGLSQYLLCSYKDGVRTSYVNNVFQGSCRITGIPESKPKESFTIYPNPAQSQLFIKSESKVEGFRILNAFGASVFEPKINRQQVIDISALPSGLYILQTTFRNGKVSRQRFVKQY